MRSARVLVCALAMVGCQGAEPPPASPPSVFLFMIDTLRADYLGAYGFEGPISPNLDRLAAESVVFENCASVAPWTKPAIASLLTGLDPSVHQVLTHDGRYGEGERRAKPRPLETDVLPDAAMTLAEVLRARGYATGAFVANPWISAKHGFQQGFDRFDARFADNATPAEPVLDAAQAWLDRRQGRDQPVFAYLHFMDVHDPYDAADEDIAAVRGSPSFGAEQHLAEEELPLATVRNMRLLRLPWALSAEVHSLREWRTRYAGGVRALDRRLGPFLDRLRADGWLDRSVVIVTSDHGEELFEHGGWVHGRNLYEHQLAVPLIVRLPEGASAGRRVRELVSLVDLMPTVVALAGGEAPDGMTGIPFTSLLQGKRGKVLRQAAFASGVKSRPKLHAVRSQTHKLIQTLGEEDAALFDLTADPGEQENVMSKLPAVAFALGDLLDRHLAEAGRHSGIGRSSAVIGSETEERLRALGYLE